MITKQLNDNDIAIKMLSLMRIKKLNAVAVYYQEKQLELWNTAIVSSCSTWKRCNWHSHFQAARSSRGMVNGIKKIDKF